MKKIVSTFILSLIIATSSAQEQTIKPYTWSAGIRTGAVHETFGFKSKYKELTNPIRQPKSALFNQLFLNRTFGRSGKWMMEAAFAYYSHSVEAESAGITMSGQHFYYYSFNRTHNLNYQLTLRYRFYRIESFDWNHYIGLSTNINGITVSKRGYRKEPGEQEALPYTTKETDRKLYLGLDYFGSINLNQRLSIQYNLNYSINHPVIDLFQISYAPGLDVALHRLYINFGIGWAFHGI